MRNIRFLTRLLRRRFSSGGGKIRSGDAFLIGRIIIRSPFVLRERHRESGVKKCTVRLIQTFWSGNFGARPEGSLMLTHRDLQIDVNGMDF
jgi:hypothetical protein